MVHTLCIRIHCEDLTSFPEEMDKVPSVPATSVEDTHPGRDISSQDLIEDVDIDLAELLLHVHRNLSHCHSHPAPMFGFSGDHAETTSVSRKSLPL